MKPNLKQPERRARGWGGAALACALLACQPSVAPCQTGASAPCTCVEGRTGTQRCNASGAFDRCSCGGTASGGGTAATGGGAGGGGGGGGGGSGGDAGLFDSTRFLDSCLAYGSACAEVDGGPDCGKCQYRLRFDPRRCSPASPCDTLFLLWAAMGCEGTAQQQRLDRLLAAHPTYVVACAQPLYPGETLPSTLGAPQRENALLSALFTAVKSDPQTGVWNGRNLLMAGCSAGATRYPVVAARYPDDAQWLGTVKNGACFSDGVYNIALQDRFTGDLLDGGVSCQARHARIARGFTVSIVAPGHSCATSPAAQCACDPAHANRAWPGECGGGACSGFESIVVPASGTFTFAPGIGASNFAVPHWKLVAEGSNFFSTPERCLKDVAPEGPISGLCQALAGDPTKTCAFTPLPSATHCSDFWQDLSTHCGDWFEAL